MSLIVQRDFFISNTSAKAHWVKWIVWQLEASYSVILQAWHCHLKANFVSNQTASTLFLSESDLCQISMTETAVENVHHYQRDDIFIECALT